MAKHGDNKQVAASARKARLRNLRLMRAFAFVVILCTAFVAGFAVRSNDALLESLGITALLESGDSTAGTAASKDKNTYNALSARVAEVEDALATCLLDGTLASGDTAVLAAENGTLCVRRREKAAAAALGDVGAQKA